MKKKKGGDARGPPCVAWDGAKALAVLNKTCEDDTSAKCVYTHRSAFRLTGKPASETVAAKWKTGNVVSFVKGEKKKKMVRCQGRFLEPVGLFPVRGYFGEDAKLRV